jgi:lipoprotein-anchoring transpeptidase ErfK/SrfK
VEVSVPDQRLRVFDGLEEVASFVISTSKFGLGSDEGSNKTPLGEFEIGEKIGDGAEPRTIFRSREVVGVWDAEHPPEEDLVLTRILWLHGREDGNANTRERYIYIHGTNQEELIGTEASHGCVRMRNDEVIDLYEMLEVGTPVTIVA